MNQKTTRNQTHILLYLSSILFFTTLSSDALNDNIWDSILSCVFAFGLNILFALPYFKIYNTQNTFTQYIKNGKITPWLFIVYFILTDIIALSRMTNLYTNTIFPQAPPMVIVILLLSVGLYGCYKGVNSVKRSSLIVVLSVIIALALTICGLVNIIDFNNREQFFFTGTKDFFNNTIIIFIRSSILPQLFILSNNSNFKTFVKYQVFTTITIILVFLVAVLSLARFSQTQLFPFYTLFTIANLAPFERLDIMFSIISLMLLVTKIAVDFLAIKEIFAIKNKFLSKTISVFAVLIFFASIIFIGKNACVLVYSDYFMLLVLILLCTIVPCLSISKR